MPPILICLLLVALACPAGRAADRTWNGSADGDWFTAGNWLPAGDYPKGGDRVVVNSGSLLLTNATEWLESFTLTNATLTFTNWGAKLSASTVTISNGGSLTLPAAFSNAATSNRVWIACTNFTLDTGGTINADAKGFRQDNGPGAGQWVDWYGTGGGGHGGRGGAGKHNLDTTTGDGYGSGAAYGSTNMPTTPGSGGSSAPRVTQYGGHGGGAILIDASGSVIVNGKISANGGDATGASANGAPGGGSGGSIFITCATFGGNTNGWLQSDGGAGGIVATLGGGGGGGGRIAVNYTSLIGLPGIRFSAKPGTGWWSVDINSTANSSAKPGTVWFPDETLMNSILTVWGGLGGWLNGFNGFLHIGSGDTYTWTASGGFALTNSILGLPESCTWNIPGDLNIATGVVIVACGGALNCQGSLNLLANSRLIAYGGATNGLETLSGAFVGVSNDLTIASNAWIYPFSHHTNGGSVFFKAGGNVSITNGGGIDATGRGYGRTYGYGKGGNQTYSAGGGGHGGKGGRGVHANGNGAAGVAWGSSNAPITAGSGGGNQTTSIRYGNHGGGVVWIQANRNITIHGDILANPSTRPDSIGYAGAGAGGSIFLDCGGTFDGHGNLQADGGNYCASGATCGGGGGGRIAVWQGLGLTQRAKAWNNNLAGLRVAANFSATQYTGDFSVDYGTSVDVYPDANAAFPGTVAVISRFKGAIFSVH